MGSSDFFCINMELRLEVEKQEESLVLLLNYTHSILTKSTAILIVNYFESLNSKLFLDDNNRGNNPRLSPHGGGDIGKSWLAAEGP